MSDLSMKDAVASTPRPQSTPELNPEMIKPKKYLCFSEAHNFARSLNFKTRKEWRLYVKGELAEKPHKPEDIPAHPDGIYRLKGWQGWKYWLGTVNQDLDS
ncbi:MAG: hypothetical protein KA436_01895 [Oligoflexales bacterium]|nr:hypothetical protein [Oligoflexales bacterium]